jgi:hypothetical protein
MCTHSWLSLDFDIGGEVFECPKVATTKAPEDSKIRGAGDIKPPSAIVMRLAGTESAWSGIRHQYHFW